MKQQPLTKAFGHAVDGLIHFLKTDRNGKIHALAAISVVIAGSYLDISRIEWCILILCIVTVISIEMINHAIEKLCDAVHPGMHPIIKTVKDISAGAVLWSALASSIIGLIIFIPKLISLL